MTKEYRRARQHYRVITTDPQTGDLVKLAADENGVLEIKNDKQRRVADERKLAGTRLPALSNEEVADLQKKAKAQAEAKEGD